MYFAGEKTGLTFENGAFGTECSGIRIVLLNDEAKLHSYPQSFEPKVHRCANCDLPIPSDPRE